MCVIIILIAAVPCLHVSGQYIPQISFKDLGSLQDDEVQAIKRKGCMVIKDVVDDAEASSWKSSLEAFVKANPNVQGESH